MTDDPRKWVQIANDVRDRINAGQLKPHDRVSVKYESQARETTRETAAKALQALAAEGRLKLFPGHGYVVVGSDLQSET